MKEKIELEITDQGFGKTFNIYEIEFIEENYHSKMRFLDEDRMNEFIKNLDVPIRFVKITLQKVWID